MEYMRILKTENNKNVANLANFLVPTETTQTLNNFQFREIFEAHEKIREVLDVKRWNVSGRR